MKSSRGIAVQFHHRVLTDFQQAGFTVIHGQIDSGLRGVHDFGEGFAGLEFPSSEIFHMRCGYDTVHRRTQVGFLERLLGAFHFGFPIIGLHAVDAGFAAVVGGQRAIHLQHGRIVFGLRFRQGRAQVPRFHLRQHFAALHRLPFVHQDFADHAFNFRLNQSAPARRDHRVAIDAQRHWASHQKKQADAA